MAALTVEVLCPNGRRQKVKTTSSSAVLHILEECCKKQGYSHDEYDLKHQRTVLDVTSLIRFANLSNNAKLELVKRSKPRTAAQVVIALQLESGGRLQGSFKATATLLDVLRDFEKQNNGESLYTDCPVCIYTSTEVSGIEALRKTKLQDLGLVGGRAVVRLVSRKTQDCDVEILKRAETQQCRNAGNVSGDSAQQTQPAEILLSKESIKDEGFHASDSRLESASVVSMECVSTEGASSPVTTDLTNRPAVNAQHSQSSTSSSSCRPKEPSTKPRVTKDNVRFESNVSHVGAAKDPRSGFGDLAPEEKKLKLSNSRSSFDNTPPFANFKFPDRVARPQEINVEPIDPVKLRKEVELGMPCPRHPILFPVHSASEEDNSASLDDVPDEFFDVTVEDVRKMLRDLKSEREQIENTPLMTSAMRQSDDAKRLGTYDKVVLRVCFPDGVFLQGFFRPLEEVKAVTEFVNEYVHEAKAQSTYLYTAPPRFILNDQTKTLLEMSLVPSSIIYIGSRNGVTSLLRDSYKDRISFRMEAEELVQQELARSVEGPDGKDVSGHNTSHENAENVSTSHASSSVSANGQAGQSSRNPSHSSSSATRPKDPKVPKWLRLGK